MLISLFSRKEASDSESDEWGDFDCWTTGFSSTSDLTLFFWFFMGLIPRLPLFSAFMSSSSSSSSSSSTSWWERGAARGRKATLRVKRWPEGFLGVNLLQSASSPSELWRRDAHCSACFYNKGYIFSSLSHTISIVLQVHQLQAANGTATTVTLNPSIQCLPVDRYTKNCNNQCNTYQGKDEPCTLPTIWFGNCTLVQFMRSCIHTPMQMEIRTCYIFPSLHHI